MIGSTAKRTFLVARYKSLLFESGSQRFGSPFFDVNSLFSSKVIKPRPFYLPWDGLEVMYQPNTSLIPGKTPEEFFERANSLPLGTKKLRNPDPWGRK